VTATYDGYQARGWTEVDPRDGGELWDLEAQLIARFSPPLRPEAVQRCLCDVVAHYDAARVRTYVAALIERRATEQLQAAAADAGRSPTRRRIAEVRPRNRPVRLVASDEDC
jgi:hypothetical protein